MQNLFLLAFCMSDNVGQILSLEAHAKNLTSLLERKSFLNVLHHFGGGGSGQCQDRNIRQKFADIGNVQVSRSEIISPLGDTMRFVYGNHADLHAFQFGLEDFRIQAFRGNI